MVMAAVPKKRRRSWLISSEILVIAIGESPFDGWLWGFCMSLVEATGPTSEEFAKMQKGVVLLRNNLIRAAQGER